ncbi:MULTISPECIES: MBL fold metallo-hydrolase [unclassified Leucobacter]|uniref:MBL fold metallo-hydrolase n=1 Tax=unclassified Leucobacter TaxID=2621730 RepID=UPI000A07D94B|nr:MBL fold metallo-hydrolase [Leucobacter sp. Ag1]
MPTADPFTVDPSVPEPLVGQRHSAEPLGVRWIHGSPSAKHNTDPDLQVHWVDPHTAILRQNKAIDYEAPFLFLLFGEARAVLIDTGATADPDLLPLRRTVDELIEGWLGRHPRPGYELVVLHTHAHGDHVAGDAQFADRPRTVVVPADRTAAWSFLGIADDDAAAEPGRVELGGRVLLAIGAPGHERSAVVFYDPWTGFLLTGDTVYRGRLYVDDWAAYSRTIDRLIAFAQEHPVTLVLGCHIEMTSEPGVDYPIRTTYQPDEPPLELPPEVLGRIRAVLDAVGDAPARRADGDFIIWPE